MKLKNILFGTLAVSVLSMGTMSCSDSFLDEEMYSKYSPEGASVDNRLVGYIIRMLACGDILDVKAF